MGADGVSDVTDVDGVQVLVVTGLLNKDLLESKSCIEHSDSSVAINSEDEYGSCKAHLVVEVIEVP